MKLASAETSSDVFELASYAPLEIKRALLRKLFVIARHRLKPEYREEAERRITEDIVPMIFASPELELALLTGLIVKPKASEAAATVVESPKPVVEPLLKEEETSIASDYEEAPVIPERDAEKELQSEISRLNRAVPKVEVEKVVEEEEEDDYIPFSDMENELNQQQDPHASAPAPMQPEAKPERIGDPHYQPSQPSPQPPSQPQKAQVPPPPMNPNVARPPQYMPGPPYPPMGQPYPPNIQYPQAPYPPFPAAPYSPYGKNEPTPPDIEHTQPRKPAA
jgi:hypothetical protein